MASLAVLNWILAGVCWYSGGDKGDWIRLLSLLWVDFGEEIRVVLFAGLAWVELVNGG